MNAESKVLVADAVPTPGMSRLGSVTLEELDNHAALQTRIDRKYLVPRSVVEQLLTDFSGRLLALQIDGQRSFGYRSVYFDTPDLLSYHQHLQGRLRRFKVRTRTYLQTGLCRLEVKTKSPRRETVKKSKRHTADDAASLTEQARHFIAQRLDEDRVADRLNPALETWYERATLLDVPSGSRVTCDTHISWQREAQKSSAVSTVLDTGLDGVVLVETKSQRGAGPVDRWLWRYHLRPQSISKYCLGQALLQPHLQANRWHPVLKRHFDWHPPAPPTIVPQQTQTDEIPEQEIAA